MAVFDRNKFETNTKSDDDGLVAFVRYPEHQTAFDDKHAKPSVIGSSRRSGPKGLSLVARVYE